MIPKLSIKKIDRMTPTELGLLLAQVAEFGLNNTSIPGVYLHRILTRASSLLVTSGVSNRHELMLNTPRYSQLELDLMDDWSEVSPEEIFADLDEYEMRKMGYAIAVDHRTSVN